MNIKKYYKRMVTKKNIIRATLILWLIFSLGYIAQDQWGKFKIGALNDAYMAGRTESIYELMANLKNKNCDPITVYTEEEKIDVINIKCLQKTVDQNEQVVE